MQVVNQQKYNSFASQITMFLALGYVPISSSALRPLGAAYVPILLCEVEQEQKHSGNGDREAIVLGDGLCDVEGERAYTVYNLILVERERPIWCS